MGELKFKGVAVGHRYLPSDPSKITGTFCIKDGRRFPNPANPADRLQQNPVQSPRPSSPQEEQGFAGGGGITWPEYRAAHMDLPVQEALRRFRALKRGQYPNTMTGEIRI